MEEYDLIPLSALQHYLYCPRQCALIHVERLWAENRQTAEGRLLHERVDQPGHRAQSGVHVVTSMPLAHEVLGIVGVADVVEFSKTNEGQRAYPVEYKRGRPKAHRADEVQLCAQALCLEEMLGFPVPEGALFYGKTRRRKTVLFDQELRNLTVTVIAEVRQMIASNHTPMPIYESSRCDRCSLIELCLPKVLAGSPKLEHWLRDRLKD